jgi:hypothetical protein
VRFLIGDGSLRGAGRVMITLRVGAARPLAGEIWFNGRRVARLTIPAGEAAYHVIGIPRSLVRTIEYDVLETNVLEWRATREGEETPLLFQGLRVHAGRRRAS